MTVRDGTILGATRIFGPASASGAFTIALLAEGFTAAEQSRFDAAADAFVAALLATPPYPRLRGFIRVVRVNVASVESGADDPPGDGGTGARVRSYFDASFGATGIRRLLVCETATALTTAAVQVPASKLAIVIVNSTIYGGSGGDVAVYSLAPGAEEIALHEMGHTAFKLADEYAYYARPDEAGHDHHPAGEPAEPNVTCETRPDRLKWARSLSPGTAVPTMRNANCALPDPRPSPFPAGTVGLFEGARYYRCGAFRPEYDCRMRTLGQPFCRVCQAAIMRCIAPAGVPSV